MREIILQLITAFLGSLGFAILFGIRSRYLLLAALGGMLSWSVYLGVHTLAARDFLAYLTAAVFAMAYSELLAHLRKCPATLFVVPAIIPLVPGTSLYYTMDSAAHGDLVRAGEFGYTTLTAALAIAAGISLVTVIHSLRMQKS